MLKRTIIISLVAVIALADIASASENKTVEFNVLKECKAENIEGFKNPLIANTKKISNWFEKAKSSKESKNIGLAKALTDIGYNFEIQEQLTYLETSFINDKCEKAAKTLRLKFYDLTDELKEMIGGTK